MDKVYAVVETGPECWEYHQPFYNSKEPAVLAASALAESENAWMESANELLWAEGHEPEFLERLLHHPFAPTADAGEWKRHGGFWGIRVVEISVHDTYDPRLDSLAGARK